MSSARSDRHIQTGQRLLAETRWARFYNDEVELPDGELGRYTCVRAKGGVIVVPRLTDGRVLLIRALRYPVMGHAKARDGVWEFPRGSIDGGEAADHAAVRELLEETGIKVNTRGLHLVGLLYPESGLLDIGHRVFLADVPWEERLNLKLGEDEGLVGSKWLKPGSVKWLLRKGELVDGTALAALTLLRFYLK